MKKIKQKSRAHRQVKKMSNKGICRGKLRERDLPRPSASFLPRITVVSICIALLLIAFVGAHLPAFAHTGLQVSMLATSSPVSPGTSGLLRFNDPNEGTALSVQTNPNDASYGVFTFTSPEGEQYHGGDAGDLLPGGDGLLALQFPDRGLKTSLSGGTVQTFGGPTMTGRAVVSLTGIIDTVNGRAEKVQLTEFLSTFLHRYFLNSVVGPIDETIFVDRYDMAATSPTPRLFNLTSRLVTAGYTESDFNRIVQSQVQKVGRIIKIVPGLRTPQTTDPAGITYFTVVEQITRLKNDGSVQIENVIAVFILEDGQWKFWFSHRI